VGQLLLLLLLLLLFYRTVVKTQSQISLFLGHILLPPHDNQRLRIGFMLREWRAQIFIYLFATYKRHCTSFVLLTRGKNVISSGGQRTKLRYSF